MINNVAQIDAEAAYSFYSNPEYDALVSAEYPVVPLYYKSNNYLLKDDVQGVYMTSSASIYFKNAVVYNK